MYVIANTERLNKLRIKVSNNFSTPNFPKQKVKTVLPVCHFEFLQWQSNGSIGSASGSEIETESESASETGLRLMEVIVEEMESFFIVLITFMINYFGLVIL